MKQSDVALLIIVIAISLAASYLIGGKVINKPENRQTQVEVVREYSTSFPSPNEDPLSESADIIYNRIFTKDAVNPTETIQIGPGQNTDPFTNTE
ncbi:hypothetical protein DYH10_01580 [Candidatus Saccharibacteria bacterium CPR2]|nr:hypothetical protein [Candidatus Saccharibacteria bacterium CPR2]